ncbi:MAG: hypothetical protein E7546_07870 [Ruminococcaceae bacterium]|nr:hypothetical protein [Oscillospiraceae bacterium]
MKLKTLIIAAMLALLTLGGCSTAETASSPDLGIDWESIIARIDADTLYEYGWYADIDSLASDAEDLGTITFSNYDPTEADAFKSVSYQFCIDYGEGFTLTDSGVVFYDTPVYCVTLIDNESDGSYLGTFDEDFNLLSEEGEWFLAEDKDEYITLCLENCRNILFGKE